MIKTLFKISVSEGTCDRQIFHVIAGRVNENGLVRAQLSNFMNNFLAGVLVIDVGDVTLLWGVHEEFKA